MTAPPPAEHRDTLAPEALHAMLTEQLDISHRVAMSGMETVAAWSERLRQTSPAGEERYAELIGRLGQSLTRMMAEARRAAVTLERLQRRAATPATVDGQKP